MISAARLKKTKTVTLVKSLTLKIGLGARISHHTKAATPKMLARISHVPDGAGSREKPYINAARARPKTVAPGQSDRSPLASAHSPFSFNHVKAMTTNPRGTTAKKRSASSTAA